MSADKLHKPSATTMEDTGVNYSGITGYSDGTTAHHFTRTRLNCIHVVQQCFQPDKHPDDPFQGLDDLWANDLLGDMRYSAVKLANGEYYAIVDTTPYASKIMRLEAFELKIDEVGVDNVVILQASGSGETLVNLIIREIQDVTVCNVDAHYLTDMGLVLKVAGQTPLPHWVCQHRIHLLNLGHLMKLAKASTHIHLHTSCLCRLAFSCVGAWFCVCGVTCTSLALHT